MSDCHAELMPAQFTIQFKLQGSKFMARIKQLKKEIGSTQQVEITKFVFIIQKK